MELTFSQVQQEITIGTEAEGKIRTNPGKDYGPQKLDTFGSGAGKVRGGSGPSV